MTEKIWRAFHTKARHEKAIADRKSAEGFEVYCPIKEIRVRWADRWKLVKQPLLNGYIFARVNEAERLLFLKDPGVERTVIHLGRPGVIRDEEIKALKYLMEEYEDVNIQPLQLGTRAKIVYGDLKDLEGVVLQSKGDRVKVRFEALSIEVVADVHRSKLEPKS